MVSFHIDICKYIKIICLCSSVFSDRTDESKILQRNETHAALGIRHIEIRTERLTQLETFFIVN